MLDVTLPSKDIDEEHGSPMQWDEYETLINGEWADLMKNKKTSVEDVKTFLTRHPCMLPMNPVGAEPGFPALILNPILPTYTGTKPDFLLISINSKTIYANFFMLGNPLVKLNYNNFNIPEVSKTIDYIYKWEAWFRDGNNCMDFLYLYRMSDYKGLSFKQNYFYIFGRRTNVVDGELANLRDSKFNGNKEDMSYDRLSPNRLLDYLCCVKPLNNSFKVKSVPPTLESLCPYDPEHNNKSICSFEEMDIAIEENKYVNEKRKAYLINTCSKQIEDAKKKTASSDNQKLSCVTSKDKYNESIRVINRKAKTSLLSGERKKNTFCKSGESWIIRYEENDGFIINNSDGLNYIHVLLDNTDKDIFVTDLIKQAGTNSNQSDYRGPRQSDIENEDDQDIPNVKGRGFNGIYKDDIYDSKSKEDMKEEISALIRDKENEEKLGNYEKAAEIQNAIEFCAKEIKASKKGAKFASEYKGETVKVKNAINRAYKKIKDQDESLCRHLKNCIKTGVYSSYKPDKRMDWDLNIFQ